MNDKAKYLAAEKIFKKTEEAFLKKSESDLKKIKKEKSDKMYNRRQNNFTYSLFNRNIENVKFIRRLLDDWKKTIENKS